MSRRIEVELTSTREDGSWTWRAAGAKEPKGQVEGSLVPAGSAVGDVLRADVEFYVDGIEVTAFVAPKETRSEPETLELLGSGSSDDRLVTTTLAPRRGGRDRDRGRGDRDRGDRDRGDRPRRRDDRGPRQERSGPRDRPDRGQRRQEPRERRDAEAAKPKPKRLRPRRTHRDAALNALPEEQRPLAELLLDGGVPGVRKAIAAQNAEARSEGIPAVPAEPLVTLAEQIFPTLRAAEWHDRAEAAIAGLDEIDLRDIRSVVVAADSAARDDETRALASQLRDGLAARVDREHQEWLTEIATTLADGRTVRALRLSSRPPKAGAPLPADLAQRLIEAANASLTADISAQRWGTVLDAVAFSPVRGQVRPESMPDKPSDELLQTVRKVASRVPDIAAAFGVEAAPEPRRGRRSGPRRGPAPTPPPPPPPPTAS
ncbi:MAG: hypothetical protein KDB21_20275 [Acidimicrobiales bacterium]|nr:hypothetical protein [Acidimicrobiales bacterium]